jgi:hypothetical protein
MKMFEAFACFASTTISRSTITNPKLSDRTEVIGSAKSASSDEATSADVERGAVREGGIRRHLRR